MRDYGRIDVVLDDYLKEHKISRSSLTRNTELQYSQILRYCRNDVQKLDLTILAKLCTVLDCNIEDILKLTKGKWDKGTEQLSQKWDGGTDLTASFFKVIIKYE